MIQAKRYNTIQISMLPTTHFPPVSWANRGKLATSVFIFYFFFFICFFFWSDMHPLQNCLSVSCRKISVPRPDQRECCCEPSKHQTASTKSAALPKVSTIGVYHRCLPQVSTKGAYQRCLPKVLHYHKIERYRKWSFSLTLYSLLSKRGRATLTPKMSHVECAWTQIRKC